MESNAIQPNLIPAVKDVSAQGPAPQSELSGKSFEKILSDFGAKSNPANLMSGAPETVEEMGTDFQEKRLDISSKIREAIMSGDSEHTLAQLQQEYDTITQEARRVAERALDEALARLSNPESPMAGIKMGRFAKDATVVPAATAKSTEKPIEIAIPPMVENPRTERPDVIPDSRSNDGFPGLSEPKMHSRMESPHLRATSASEMAAPAALSNAPVFPGESWASFGTSQVVSPKVSNPRTAELHPTSAEPLSGYTPTPEGKGQLPGSQQTLEQTALRFSQPSAVPNQSSAAPTQLAQTPAASPLAMSPNAPNIATPANLAPQPSAAPVQLAPPAAPMTSPPGTSANRPATINLGNPAPSNSAPMPVQPSVAPMQFAPPAPMTSPPGTPIDRPATVNHGSPAPSNIAPAPAPPSASPVQSAPSNVMPNGIVNGTSGSGSQFHPIQDPLPPVKKSNPVNTRAGKSGAVPSANFIAYAPNAEQANANPFGVSNEVWESVNQNARMKTVLTSMPEKAVALFRETPSDLKREIIDHVKGETHVLWYTVNHRKAFIDGQAMGRNSFDYLLGSLNSKADELMKTGKISADHLELQRAGLNILGTLTPTQREAYLGLLEAENNNAN